MSDERRQPLPTDPTDWRGPAGHVLSRDAVLAQVPDETTDPPTYRAVTVGDVLAMQAELAEERTDFESFAGHHAATEAALAAERRLRERAAEPAAGADWRTRYHALALAVLAQLAEGDAAYTFEEAIAAKAHCCASCLGSGQSDADIECERCDGTGGWR